MPNTDALRKKKICVGMTKDLSKAKMQQTLLRSLFFFIRPGLNTDIYGVNLRIQSKYRKKNGPEIRNDSVFGL